MPTATARGQQDGTQAEITPQQIDAAHFQAAPFLGEKQRILLRKGMCSGLTDDQADYFFERVERTGLDPFQDQIWPSIRQTKDEHGARQPNLVIIVKLQGFRTIGDRSGLCDGEDPIEWCGPDGVWKEEWLLPEPPMAARARVYRKDRNRPQVVVCLWSAYVQNLWDNKGNPQPNAIWKRMGPHMLGKCALAGCYRGLFPRQASGVYLNEEIGEELDPNSEAGIEAEMARRYSANKEYWDGLKEKGIYPLGQRPEEPAPPVAPEPTIPRPKPEPAPEPEPAVAVITPQNIDPNKVGRRYPEPEPPETKIVRDPRLDWRTFPITRIRALEGRTVGTLTAGELRGLASWMEKVQARWGGLDNDIKAHYSAFKQRIDYDLAHPDPASIDEDLAADLDYSQFSR